MKRTLIVVVAAVVGFAAAANAATLSVVSDSATYSVGQTITLTVTADPEGGADNSVFGRLLYSAALTETVASSQQTFSTFGGGSSWSPGALNNADGFATVLNQLGAQGTTPNQPSNIVQSTATLIAEAAGTVNVVWETDANTGFQVKFFGLTNGAGTSFNIVPEPTTAALLGLGLFGLALGGRRRS